MMIFFLSKYFYHHHYYQLKNKPTPLLQYYIIIINFFHGIEPAAGFQQSKAISKLFDHMPTVEIGKWLEQRPVELGLWASHLLATDRGVWQALKMLVP